VNALTAAHLKPSSARRREPNRYIPVQPTTAQATFLLYNGPEALYGGAAGGGKSVALLMAALQYVDVAKYNALLLRRTFAALAKPEALIPLSHEWLARQMRNGTAISIAGHSEWGDALVRLPRHEKDKFQYQGAAYHFVGWDELTQFTDTQYTYLFSRKRRTKAMKEIRRADAHACGDQPGWRGA